MDIKKLKPFNLADALAGKPVGTLTGKTVKIAGYNPEAEDFPLAGWVQVVINNSVSIESWTAEGKYLLERESESFDLYMLPVKVTKTGWMNIYPEGATSCNTVYPTKEYADLCANNAVRIDCIKIVYSYEE